MKYLKFLRSIRFKIAASFLLVFSAIAILFNIYFFQTVKKNLKEAHYSNVRLQAERILDRVIGDTLPSSQTDVHSYQVWNTSFLASQIVQQEGSFPKSFSENFTLLLPESFVSSLEAAQVLEVNEFTFGIVEAFMQGDNSQKTSVVIAMKNNMVYDQIQSLRRSLIYGYAFAILISIVAISIVSGLVLKPIKALISKAQVIKASEKMERLPISNAQDELTDLSETINAMIDRIEISIRDQSQFFASASHELRTPLANMLSEIELKMDENSIEADRRSLKSLRVEVLRLSSLVEDFLLMSQLKSDNLVIHKTTFRLDDLLYDVLEKMNASIQENDFNISLSIVPLSDLKIKGDKSKTESILVNIIQNALKYGSNSKPIRISQSIIHDTIELTILNQVDLKQQKKSGNKLGLWICGKLAEKQGFTFNTTDENGVFTARLLIPV